MALVLTGVSVASATPVDKAAVNACITVAKSAKDVADKAALDVYASVVASKDKKAIKVARKTFESAKKANVKALGIAIKACKPAKK